MARQTGPDDPVAREIPNQPAEVSLFLTGDVMTGRGIDQLMQWPCSPEIHERYMTSALGYLALAEAVSGPVCRPVGPDYIWGDAGPTPGSSIWKPP